MSKIAFQPANENIIATIVMPAPKTSSGLVLPQSQIGDIGSSVETMTAIVVAVGLGYITDDGARVPVACKPGDRILFDVSACRMIRLEGQEFITLTERAVAAIVTGLTPPSVDMLTGKMTAAVATHGTAAAS